MRLQLERIREAKIMFHKTRDNLPNSQFRTGRTHIASPAEVVFVLESAVVDCLIGFSGAFGRFFAWSFSMPLEVRFLRWRHVANGVLNLIGFDGVENLD